MASATRTAVAALRVLDSATQALIEKRLAECADQARSLVLLEHRGGRPPTHSECNESRIDEATHRRMTLAMQLGCLMHRVALDCSEAALEKVIPGGFSREQRYRYDKSRGTLAAVSEEESRGLLKSGCGDELKGTLVPDLVIHDGDPLNAHRIYDFKFPCVGTTMTQWREYPEGHAHEGMNQKELYEKAFDVPASRVLPRWGSSAMSNHYPRIRLTYGELLLVREGLSFVFFMDRPHQEVAQAVIAAMEAYLQAIGPNAIGRYASEDGEWIDLNEQEWSFVREKLLKRRAPLLLLHDTEDALYRYQFEYCGKPPDAAMAPETQHPVCAVRCWLPTEYLEQRGPAKVRELALKLASLLPFCSGHAGLAFNGELDVVGMMAKVREVCFRYPGLDLIELMHVSWEIGTRVRGPAWLTFLGQPALAGLGGVPALQEQLRAPGTTVEALPGDSAVITLGTWPEAGDILQGDTLPAYRELARVLEPWLFREQHPYSLGLSADDLLRWERRFLD